MTLSFASENFPVFAQTFFIKLVLPASSTAVPATGRDRRRTLLTVPYALKSFSTSAFLMARGRLPTNTSMSPSPPLPAAASLGAASVLGFLGLRGFLRLSSLPAGRSSFEPAAPRLSDGGGFGTSFFVNFC